MKLCSYRGKERGHLCVFMHMTDTRLFETLQVQKKRIFVLKEDGDERYSSSTLASPQVVAHARLCSVAEYWLSVAK